MKHLRRNGSWDKVLITLLLVSLFLRGILVMRGGQFYWPDEMLYYGGYQLAAAWKEGTFWQAFQEHYLTTHRHVAYPLMACIPALIQVQVMNGRGASFAKTLYLPALFFSWASVGSILLVYLIALRAGATRGEARLAAFLLSISVSWAIWARHLLPYDLSLFLLLAALWMGLKPTASEGRSFVVGLLLGLGFLCIMAFGP